MTDDDKTLVERLRGDWPEILVEKHWMMDSDAIDKQREEAADRIEALSADVEQARMEERTAIVAWLRDEVLERTRAKHQADPMTFQYFCREAEQRELENQADAIEAGEHLK